MWENISMIFAIKNLVNNNLSYLTRFCKSTYLLSFENLLLEIINIDFIIFKFAFNYLVLSSGVNFLLENFKINKKNINYKNKNIENTDLKCQICMDDEKDSDIVSVCYNNHFYHSECINLWLKSSNIIEKKCPECRQDIKLSVIKKKKILIEVFKKIHSKYILNSNKTRKIRDNFQKDLINMLFSPIDVNLLHLNTNTLNYPVKIIKDIINHILNFKFTLWFSIITLKYYIIE